MADLIERYFQCTRCKHKFVVKLKDTDLDLAKCPRSCPVKVVDITEATKKHKENRKAIIKKKEDEKVKESNMTDVERYLRDKNKSKKPKAN